MKPTNILAASLVALSLIMSGCGGTTDYVQAVQITSSGTSTGGFYNLVGIDGTLQLNVNAVYHSGKTIPVTADATYTVTTVGVDDTGNPLPAYDSTPAPVPIDETGLMTAVASLCTWIDAGTPPPTPPKYNWEYTGYYQVVANYKGQASQPIAIGVGSQASNTAPDGSCGPQ